MATKTITIDLEAYERLHGHKRNAESFSEVIKRLVKPPFDVNAWFRAVKANSLAPTAIEAIEEQIEARQTRSRRER